MKALKNLGDTVVKSGAWKKLADPSASRGKTEWPKSKADLEKIGVRLDYDGPVDQNGVTYHKYQCQPNAGKVPSSIKDWREANGGTHAVMTSIYVKKGANKEEVQAAIDQGVKKVSGT